MATLIRPRSWGAQKPPLGSQVNWDHPLAQGLQECFLFNEGNGSFVWSIASTSYGRIPASGVAWVPGGLRLTTGSIPVTVNRRIDPITQMTAMGRGSFVPVNDWTSFLWGDGSSDGFGLYWMADGTMRVPVHDDGWGDTVTTDTGLALPIIRNIATISYEGLGTRAVGIDNKIFTRAGYGTPAVYLNASMQIGTDSHDLSGRVLPGFYESIHFWNRALTADQIAWLAEEPYAFINPPAPKVLYYSVNAGSSTVTGTVAATLGAFTSSATGGYGPSGTIAVTLAAFISAISGSSVTGTSAKTLANFTSTASGATGPSGTIAATLAAFTSAISAGFGPSGTVAQTLAAFTSTATGSSVTGTSAQTLSPFIATASGSFDNGVTGTIAATLAAFTASMAGSSVVGSVAVTLNPFTSSASGSVVGASTGGGGTSGRRYQPGMSEDTINEHLEMLLREDEELVILL